MKRVMLIVVMTIALSYCENSKDDSLLWKFLDHVTDYGDEFVEYNKDFAEISGALDGSEFDNAMGLHQIASTAVDLQSRISDVVFIYLIIRNEDDRTAVRKVINNIKPHILKRLDLLGGDINLILPYSKNKHLIAKGNQLNEKIDEFAKTLRDFKF